MRKANDEPTSLVLVARRRLRRDAGCLLPPAMNRICLQEDNGSADKVSGTPPTQPSVLFSVTCVRAVVRGRTLHPSRHHEAAAGAVAAANGASGTDRDEGLEAADETVLL
jgi:hypothetical protein